MRWKPAAVLCIAVCLAVDFFPYSGRPNFRYTGSDPSKHVWNFGWPLATAIYDSRSGLHEGPGAFVLLPIQAVALIVATIAMAASSKTRCVRGGRH